MNTPQSIPKLPKGLNDHPLAASIDTWFRQNQGPLRPGGEQTVAALQWTPQLEAAIFAVQHAEHLLQGLELIRRAMEKETHGLQSVSNKTGVPVPERLSRLLILSCDGSDRFYRQAESVLSANQERMTGCIVSTDSLVLGSLFSKKKLPLKALLINDRKALEIFLLKVFANLPQK
jgi:hypothetical protein